MNVTAFGFRGLRLVPSSAPRPTTPVPTERPANDTSERPSRRRRARTLSDSSVSTERSWDLCSSLSMSPQASSGGVVTPAGIDFATFGVRSPSPRANVLSPGHSRAPSSQRPQASAAASGPAGSLPAPAEPGPSRTAHASTAAAQASTADAGPVCAKTPPVGPASGVSAAALSQALAAGKRARSPREERLAATLAPAKLLLQQAAVAGRIDQHACEAGLVCLERDYRYVPEPRRNVELALACTALHPAWSPALTEAIVLLRLLRSDEARAVVVHHCRVLSARARVDALPLVLGQLLGASPLGRDNATYDDCSAAEIGGASPTTLKAHKLKRKSDALLQAPLASP